VSGAWWAAFGPADTSLRCGDGQHRLQWRDGTLRALDHPDAEGELVLGALGGDTSPCLDLLMAWGKHTDDLAVLTIGPRSASDQLTIPASVVDEIAAASGGGQVYHGLGNPAAQAVSIGGTISRRSSAASSSVTRYPFRRVKARRAASYGLSVSYRGRQGSQKVRLPGFGRPGWSGFAPVGMHTRLVAGWGRREIDEAQAELIRLLALGSPFQFRLSAAVAHAWSAGGANAARAERARPALTAALAGRLAPAAAEWLHIKPDDVEVNVHDDAGWGELALAKSGQTDRLTARLPVGWLASVWAPGFAVVDGYLVVRLVDASWPNARVLAIRSPRSDPAELSIRQDKGHWCVTSL
jgi:hypothetical protein